MKAYKLYEKIGEMTIKHSRTYPIYIKDKDDNWVEARATINHARQRIEIEEEPIK